MSDEGKLYYRVYWVGAAGGTEGFGHSVENFDWISENRHNGKVNFLPDFYIAEEYFSDLLAISDESYREEIERHVAICNLNKKYSGKLRLADEKKSKEMLEIVEKYLADKKG